MTRLQLLGTLSTKLRNATGLIFVVSGLVLVFEHFGMLSRFENWGTYFFMALQPLTEVKDITIIGITDEEYHSKDLFEGKSPLKAEVLERIIRRILLGEPTVLGVDLDTSDESFRKITDLPRSAVIWAVDAELDRKRNPIYVGGAIGLPMQRSVPIGIILFPQDEDGVIRRYYRTFGDTDSFPWAIVRAYRNIKDTGQQNVGESLRLNFSGDRFAFRDNDPRKMYTVRKLLTNSNLPGFRGVFAHQVVLLGGYYPEARDRWPTSVGAMAGVDVNAQAIESELQGRGIRSMNELIMLVLELILGYALVVLRFSFQHRTTLITALAIPVLALIGSFLAFRTLAMWANFVPVLTAVLLHELHGHYTRNGPTLESASAHK